MALVVDCPSCTRRLRLPDDLLGRMVRCASCGNTFEAQASAAPNPPPTPAPELPAREDLVFNDSEPCPRCGEAVPAGAARCLRCGQPFDEEEEDQSWERGVRRDSEPHRSGLLLTLGVVSIVCGALGTAFFCCAPVAALFLVAGFSCGIPAWVMGHRDLAKMRAGEMDPRGEGVAYGGRICGIIGTILNIVGLLIALGIGALLVFQSVMTSAAVPPAPTAPPPPAPRTPRRAIDFNPGWNLPVLVGRDTGRLI
jgi:predicted Zn finger-like uncharacterized protein